MSPRVSGSGHISQYSDTYSHSHTHTTALFQNTQLLCVAFFNQTVRVSNSNLKEIMAEHRDNEIETKHESFMEKMTEKLHRDDSDSEKKVKYDDDDVKKEHDVKVPLMKSKSKRLFGREKSVHEVFGGGKCKEYSLIYLFIF